MREALFCLSRGARGSPLLRCHTWLRAQRARYEKSHSAVCLTGPVVRDGVRGTDLVPSHLPARPRDLFRGAVPGGSRRRQRRAQVRRTAWLLAEWQLSVFVFLSLDCPNTAGGLARKLGGYRVSDVQQRAFDRLVAANLAFGRLDDGSVPESGRGLAKFESLLADFEISWQSDAAATLKVAAVPDATVAMPVDPRRVQIPELAGVLNPADVLPDPFRNSFLDVERRVESGWDLARPHKFCYRVDESREHELRLRLLESGMAQLIPSEDVPQYVCGRSLLAGLFSVPHKQEYDRLIFDRRPANAGEVRLAWSHLPYGPQLCRLIVREGEVVRGSGDDLRTFFYQLLNAPSSLPRNCFGREFLGDAYQAFGSAPGRRYRLCLRVLAMGDLNAVDIAQSTHRCLLQGAGCVSPAEELVYGAKLPISRTLEGLYIDDHFTISVVDRRQLHVRSGRDVEIIDQSHQAYERAHLPRSSEKAFGWAAPGGGAAETKFTVIGTQVDGVSGVVGAPALKRRHLFLLSAAALAAQRTNVKLLQRHLALFVHVLMHRREFMCVLGRVHQFLAQLPSDLSVRWPHDVFDEVAMATLLLPLAHSNVRWCIDPRLSLTDATTTHLGAVHAVVDPQLAETFYRTCETKGAYVRLDRRTLGCDQIQERGDPLAGEVCASIPWKVHRQVRCRETLHVNIQELEAICEEVRDACRRDLRPARLVNGTDSLVALGAWGRGRSSSQPLNRRLRRVLPWLVLGQKRLDNFHLASEDNVSDDPSRLKPLRDPRPAPPWLAPLLSPGCVPNRPAPLGSRLCLELFSGEGGLTQAWRQKGLAVGDPFEAFQRDKAGRPTYVERYDLSRPAVRDELLLRADRGDFDCLHFGLPCRTWGPAGRLAGGSRRACLPWGSGVLAREVEANGEWRFTVALVARVLLAGGHFCLENPDTSYVFATDLYLALCESVDVYEAHLDQCTFGLLAAGGGPCDFHKKPTRIVSSMPEIRALSRSCPGAGPGHRHVRAWGSVKIKGVNHSRTALAGVYPGALCDSWAEQTLLGLASPPRVRNRSALRALGSSGGAAPPLR